jgi:hypothetical protein
VGSAAEGDAQLAQDVRAKGAGTARIAMKSFGSAASLLVLAWGLLLWGLRSSISYARSDTSSKLRA